MSQNTAATVPPPRRFGTRWWMIGITALGLTIAYVDRASLSIAIPFVQQEYGFDQFWKGIILSSFFWSYAAFQLPSGWLIDRFGVRLVYAVAVVWWSFWTAMTAATQGIASLLGMRLMLGVGEAPVAPCGVKVVSQWFPRHERAFAASIADTGQQLGSALSLPILTALIAFSGWRMAFVVIGVAGVVWVVLWLTLFQTPRQSKRVAADELAYIEAAGAHIEAATPAGTVKWSDLFRYRTVWGMMLGYICRAYVVYFFITWYPSYLVDVHHFTLKQLGIYGAIPPFLAIISTWCGGLFSDSLVRRGISLGVARKIPIIGALVLASSIVFAAYAETTAAALAFLTLAMCSSAFAAGSVLALPADVAPTPETVGSIASLQNFGSQIGGIFSPIVTGALLAADHGSYRLPLVTAGCVCLVGALVYGFMVKVEKLPVLPERLPGAVPAAAD
jgi:ACS family glucarate transporter-like MFS transporter